MVLFLDHSYPILSQLNFMFLFFRPLVKLVLWFYFVRPLDHFILWFLFYHWTFVSYPKSTYFLFYVLLIFTLKARVEEGPFQISFKVIKASLILHCDDPSRHVSALLVFSLLIGFHYLIFWVSISLPFVLSIVNCCCMNRESLVQRRLSFSVLV